jgi:serine/threonine protein kinase
MAASMNEKPFSSSPDKKSSEPVRTVPEVVDDSTRIISQPNDAQRSSPNIFSEVMADKPLLSVASVNEQRTVFPNTKTALTGHESTLGVNSSLLAVSSHIGEFEITRVIGQGGFGVVYEAWDHALERVVAIKEYMPTSLANRQNDGSVVPLSDRHKETFDLGMRSFINEARLLAQFDHPALLKVYRFWQERGTTYMVMPCYRGDTLKQALGKKSKDVDEAWLLGIIDGVTQALAVMHSANCYHRDIAPDNIMLLEQTGLPVVLDFGAARRVITDKTQAITVILKPGYAPVEQYSDMPDMTQGAWTDVYALCAVMYVVITGRAPPPSVARLLNDTCPPLSGNSQLLERFSPRVLAAVDAGLAVRPESRLQSMTTLRSALGLANIDESADPSTTQLASGRLTLPNSGFAPMSAQPELAILPIQKKWFLARKTSAIVIVFLIGIAVLWWSQRGVEKINAKNADQAPLPLGAEKSVATVGEPSPAPHAPATSTAQIAKVFSPGDSLKDLLQGSTASFGVKAKPSKAEVRIGKDKLEFQVQSNKAGFVYVYYLSSSGEMYLLFPNALDKRNNISPSVTLSLPRTSWAMDAGGPAGADEFVVLVSERERDFKASGIQYDGIFGQFSMNILSALEAARGNGPSPLLGVPICESVSPCPDNYGATNFKIVEK